MSKSGLVKAWDVQALSAGMVAWGNDIHARAVDAMEETAIEGRDDMLRTIVTSVTPTGEERAAKGGGIQGRVDTGQMYEDVDYQVEYNAHEIVARWGWTRDFKDYYGYQDAGTKHLRGMSAIGGSFVKAMDRISARLSRITRG